jgi:hypothetical protein
VVGAFAEDTGATNAGSAYIYDVTTGALLQTLNNPTPEWDSFGISVAVSGDAAVVGAYLDSTGAFRAGSAYIYTVPLPGCVASNYRPKKCAPWRPSEVSLLAASTLSADVPAVPLPASLPLLLAGIAGLGFWSRRKKA